MKAVVRKDPLPTKHGDVVVIEYHRSGPRRRWTPHAICTQTDTWDAEWSKSCGCTLVHMSGGGCHNKHDVAKYLRARGETCCRIWMAENVQPVDYSIPLKRNVPVSDAKLQSMGYQRIPAPLGDPFSEALEVSSHIEFCEICEDAVNGDWESPCDHLAWSDEECMMLGTGLSGEDDVRRAIWGSMQKARPILGWKSLIDLMTDLRAGCRTINARQTALDILDGYYGENVEGCEAACIWLKTLGPGKKLKAAREMTLAMISGENYEEWRKNQWRKNHAR